jgi:hypothetical protein
VELAKLLKVYSVAWLMNIQHDHHQSRAIMITANPARCLDVFGCGLRLSLNQHQAKSRDVQTYRDHVDCKRHVNDLARGTAATTEGRYV